MIEIPNNPNLAAQNFTIALDGVLYTLRTAFNTRQESWYANILDGSGNPIIVGIKLPPNWTPFHIYVLSDLPPGEIIIYDTSGTGDPPQLGELGTNARVKMLYEESS